MLPDDGLGSDIDDEDLADELSAATIEQEVGPTALPDTINSSKRRLSTDSEQQGRLSIDSEPPVNQGEVKKGPTRTQFRGPKRKKAKADKAGEQSGDKQQDKPKTRHSIFQETLVSATNLEPSTFRHTSTGWKGVSSKLDRYKISGSSENVVSGDYNDIPSGCHKRLQQLMDEGYKYIQNEK